MWKNWLPFVQIHIENWIETCVLCVLSFVAQKGPCCCCCRPIDLCFYSPLFGFPFGMEKLLKSPFILWSHQSPSYYASIFLRALTSSAFLLCRWRHKWFLEQIWHAFTYPRWPTSTSWRHCLSWSGPRLPGKFSAFKDKLPRGWPRSLRPGILQRRLGPKGRNLISKTSQSLQSGFSIFIRGNEYLVLLCVIILH